MKIAENLKRFREAAGLSQMELANRVSANQSMIAHIENGFKIPSLALTVELADVLSVSFDSLVGRKNYARNIF